MQLPLLLQLLQLLQRPSHHTGSEAPRQLYSLRGVQTPHAGTADGLVGLLHVCMHPSTHDRMHACMLACMQPQKDQHSYLLYSADHPVVAGVGLEELCRLSAAALHYLGV